MPFETGPAAFESLINAGKDRGTFAPRQPRLNYISWKDGEKKIVRFLTDKILKGQFAEWVVTQDGKTQDFLIDPDGPNWVEKFGGRSREYGTGNLIPAKISTMGACVAVLRKENPLPGGKTEVADKYDTVKVGDASFESRFFGCVKQKGSNFWCHFEGMFSRYKTICDRDYEIIRRGADRSTRYDVFALEPVEELRDLETLQAFYGYGKPWNAEDADRYLFCPQTLEEWAKYYSGEERAKYWLTPREGVAQQWGGGPGWDEFKPATTSNPWVGNEDEAQAAPSGQSAFASLRDQFAPNTRR